MAEYITGNNMPNTFQTTFRWYSKHSQTILQRSIVIRDRCYCFAYDLFMNIPTSIIKILENFLKLCLTEFAGNSLNFGKISEKC